MILNLDDEIEKKRKQRQIENVYKWRKKNPEKYKKIQKKAIMKNYLKNKEKRINNQLEYYYKNKEKILKRMKEKRDKEKELKIKGEN